MTIWCACGNSIEEENRALCGNCAAKLLSQAERACGHEPVRATYPGQWPNLFVSDIVFLGNIALGNGTQWRFRMLMHNDYLAVGVQSKPMHVWRGEVLPIQVMNAYCLMKGDANNIADLINHQFERYTHHGHYFENCCRRPGDKDVSAVEIAARIRQDDV